MSVHGLSCSRSCRCARRCACQELLGQQLHSSRAKCLEMLGYTLTHMSRHCERQGKTPGRPVLTDPQGSGRQQQPPKHSAAKTGMSAAGYETKHVNEGGKAPMKAVLKGRGSCSQQQHNDHSIAKHPTPAAGNDKDSMNEKTEAILLALLPYRGAAHKAVSPRDMLTCCRR